jgi:hypothetical protein
VSRRLLVASLAAGIVGCSLALSPDELSSGGGGATTTSPDGAPADARALVDGDGDRDGPATPGDGSRPDASGDASDDADGATPPPNLVVGGDFETATPTDCQNGVNSYQGTAGGSPVAHSGAMSCQACWDGTGNFFTIDGFHVVGPPVVGATYHGQAWVRAPAGSANAQSLVAYLRTFAGGQQQAAHVGAAVALTEQWQLVEVTWQVPGPADVLNLYIANENAASGDCFLTDDVAITRVP